MLWCFYLHSHKPFLHDQKLKDGALYREASQGNLEEVKSIIAGGGNVHAVSKQTKSTILMAAAGSGKMDVVRYILSFGAEPGAWYCTIPSPKIFPFRHTCRITLRWTPIVP
ncbi:MAG: ankyrin repeat domain-containing protein [Bacteroidota bacterium]|nr:ankyrin repeat domain-containing protein [Bacteroidota bacterium]